jgi:hypothetical protein
MKTSRISKAVMGALIVMGLASAQQAQAVEKQNRKLLIVSNLTTFGDPKLVWLYQFLDGSSVTLAQTMMAPHYASIYALTGSNATSSKFVNNAATIAGQASTKALDVFIHLHGSPGTLWFVGGEKSSSSLKNELIAKNIKDKLRLLYSTACFGSSHAQDFVGAGFNAASGSVGVNANSAYEYPVIMTQLGLGNRFSDAILAGNNQAFRTMHDNLARMQGFTNVDSYKIIRGNSAVRLSSSALY